MGTLDPTPEHRIRLARDLPRAHAAILQAPHPLLARECAPVEAFDSELRHLVERMVNALRDSPRAGVGLAAPQVGVLVRVVLVKLPGHREPTVLVNPTLSNRQGRATALEGCLSVHETESFVERATRVRVDAFTVDGKPLHLKARDLLARVLQHEVDHLMGISILDVGNQVPRHR